MPSTMHGESPEITYCSFLQADYRSAILDNPSSTLVGLRCFKVFSALYILVLARSIVDRYIFNRCTVYVLSESFIRMVLLSPCVLVEPRLSVIE